MNVSIKLLFFSQKHRDYVLRVTSVFHCVIMFQIEGENVSRCLRFPQIILFIHNGLWCVFTFCLSAFLLLSSNGYIWKTLSRPLKYVLRKFAVCLFDSIHFIFNAFPVSLLLCAFHNQICLIIAVIFK